MTNKGSRSEQQPGEGYRRCEPSRLQPPIYMAIIDALCNASCSLVSRTDETATVRRRKECRHRSNRADTS